MDHSIFCGRQRELAVLKAAWQRVSTEPDYAPELHVLVAESGMGKTRIVQAFYNWLSVTADPSDGHDYWPDTLGKNGRSLQVAPPPDQCHPENPMPFLWLGLRCPDTTAHNSVRVGQVLQSEMSSLQAHLTVLQKQARQRQHLIGKVKDSALEIAALLAGAAAVVGEPIGLLKTSYDLYKIATRDGLDREPDTAERAIAAVRAFFTATEKARVPLILILDDIQFSTGENQLSKFIRQTIIDAHENAWPLLVIATSWHQEWFEDRAEYPLITVLKEARSLKHIHAENLIVHPIRPLRPDEEDPASLEPLITAKFPGLLPEQVAQILRQVDGNPRYLEEILLFLDTEPGLFQNFDHTKPLETDAIEHLHGMDIEGVIKKRYLNAGLEIYAPLALASLQGMRFYKPLVSELLEDLPSKALMLVPETTFERAEKPFGFLAENTDLFSEFVQRVHQRAAHNLLRNVVKPEPDVQTAFEDLIRNKIQSSVNLDDVERLHVSELATAVFTDPEDFDTARTALVAWINIGNEADARYAFADAIVAFDAAITFGEVGNKTEGVEAHLPAFLNSLAGAHMNKGNALQGLQRLEDAVGAYDAAIEIMSGLRSRLGDATPPAFLNSLAAAHMNKGNALQGLQRLDKARACYEIALDAWQDLADRYPQNEEFRARRDMAYSLLKSID